MSVNLTANSPERLAALVLTLGRIGAARAGAAEPPDPPCLTGHAHVDVGGEGRDAGFSDPIAACYFAGLLRYFPPGAPTMLPSR